MNLRDQMPMTAAFIDAMRSEFGHEINDSIRSGLRGKPDFWASENGHEVGTRDTHHAVAVSNPHRVIT